MFKNELRFYYQYHSFFTAHCFTSKVGSRFKLLQSSKFSLSVENREQTSTFE